MKKQKFKNELPGWRKLRGMSLGQLAKRYLDPGDISTTHNLVGNAFLARVYEVEKDGWSTFTSEDRKLIFYAMRMIRRRQRRDDGVECDDVKRRALKYGRSVLRERFGIIASLTPEQVDEARRYDGPETVGRFV